MPDDILKFNPDELTIGDLEDFEDTVGMPLSDAFKTRPVRDADGGLVLDEETQRPVYEAVASAKALKTLVWILKRQDDPTFTLEQAREVRFSKLNLDVGENPTESAAPSA